MNAPTPTEVWARMLDHFRTARVPTSTMALWIEPGKPLRIEDNRLVVEFPVGTYGWTVRRYRHLLGEAARKEGLEGVRIVAALTRGEVEG